MSRSLSLQRMGHPFMSCHIAMVAPLLTRHRRRAAQTAAEIARLSASEAACFRTRGDARRQTGRDSRPVICALFEGCAHGGRKWLLV